jgi:hypothetical protein
MNYIFLMAILDPFADLSEDVLRHIFREFLVSLFLQVLYQGLNTNELHEEVDLLWILYNLEQFYYAGVIKFF